MCRKGVDWIRVAQNMEMKLGYSTKCGEVLVAAELLAFHTRTVLQLVATLIT